MKYSETRVTGDRAWEAGSRVHDNYAGRPGDGIISDVYNTKLGHVERTAFTRGKYTWVYTCILRNNGECVFWRQESEKEVA